MLHLNARNIVAISGKRGSGKSTLADILVKKGFVKASFAGPLKSRVMADFGMTLQQVNGDQKEIVDLRYGMTPRQLMIRYGGFFRSIQPNFWVEQMAKSLLSYDKPIVIDDMRYVNEADMLRGRGAHLVRLARLPEDNIYQGDIDDPSETSLDNYMGFNSLLPGEYNRTPQDLENFADQIIRKLEDIDIYGTCGRARHEDFVYGGESSGYCGGDASSDEFDFYD